MKRTWVVALTFILSGCSSLPKRVPSSVACDPGQIANIRSDLEAHHRVILVMSNSSACGDDDSLCDDFQSYLSDYNQAHPDLKSYLIDSEKWKQVVSSPVVTDQLTEILMKTGQPTFLHKGAIVEPQVYQYVEAVWANQTPSSDVAQFGAELQKIDITFCNVQ